MLWIVDLSIDPTAEMKGKPSKWYGADEVRVNVDS